jgi:hypothetical protein
MNARAQADPNEMAEAILEDGRCVPALFGAQLLAPGVLYGATTLVAWGMLSELVDLPDTWMDWLWIPATVIYLPILVLLGRRGRSLIPGPAAKLWNAAWTAMGLMSVAVLIALIMARGRIDTAPFLLLWPPIAFALYGGAWALLALVRRRLAYAVVAAGSFGTAIVCAALISTPAQWFVMGIGILLWVACPGAVIAARPGAAGPKPTG